MSSTIVSSGVTSSGLTVNAPDNLQVLAGGTALATAVLGGFVNDAGTLSGTLVESGGAIYVQSGGTAIATIVAATGDLTIASGGIERFATIASRGFAVVSLGGTALADTVQAGGVEQVQGTASASLVQSGGLEQVTNGGVASASQVAAGGTIDILFGGAANFTYLAGQASVHDGAQASATLVTSGGVLTVGSGGVANSGIISAGGTEIVYAGGSAAGTQIASGGTLVVLPGAGASLTQLDPGGALVSTGIVLTRADGSVSAGSATVSGASLGAGDLAYVLSGGTLAGAAVQAGASADVYAGGLARLTAIASAGVLAIEAGGLTRQAIVSAGGLVDVSAGGLAQNSLLSGGEQRVAGSATATRLGASGIEQVLAGGVADAARVGAGGGEYVLSGGLASGVDVTSGGGEFVSFGGMAQGGSIAGGLAFIYSGGVASGLLVGPGGGEIVYAGGSANATTVASGGYLEALPGAIVTNSVIQSGGVVRQGGVILEPASGPAIVFATSASGTVVGAGAQEFVLSGGLATATLVSSGGVQSVGSGGSAVLTRVDGFSSQTVAEGGVASLTYLTNYGDQIVRLGGFAQSTTIGNSGYQALAGSAAVTLIEAGGVQAINGVASATTVDSGGLARVFAGGASLAALVHAGGQEIVSGGGRANATTVASQGLLVVQPGGLTNSASLQGGAETLSGFNARAFATMVGAGGVLVVGGAAAASGSIIGAGGFGFVSAGGTLANTTIQSGGSLIAVPGSTVLATTVLAGGQVVSTGVVQLSPPAALTLYGLVADSAVVQSGSQLYVLQQGLTRHAAVTSGTEHVYAGGTADFTTVSAGTLLVAGSSFGAMLKAAAFELVSAGAVDTAAVVSSGGQQTVAGTAQGATIDRLGTETVAVGGSAVSVTLNGGLQNVFGAATATTADSAGIQAVQSGGVALSATIDAGGTEFVVAGGSAGAAIVNAGGVQNLSGAAIATATVVNSGGDQQVGAGARALGTLISSAGFQVVSALGSASGTIVQSGGVLVALPNARVAASVVLPGGSVVSTGVLATAPGAAPHYFGPVTSFGTIGSGGLDYVLPGGAAIAAMVTSGGTQLVFAGGVTTATILAGGLEQVRAGGIASATSVGAFAELAVSGLTTGTVIGAGGIEFVSAGGHAIGSLIGSGGVQYEAAARGVTATLLTQGGSLDLGFLSYDGAGSVQLNAATDVLTVSEAGTSATVQLAGDYSREYFTFGSDLAGGTIIMVEGTPCYCRGTLIATDRGERAVEDLRIGDCLITHAGAARPIRWIGTRGYDGRFAANNPEILPIRIRAGALADAIPRRDLLVSPLHAMFLDGILIPAEALLNEHSIVQVEQVDRVEYFHLELDSHDVIWAEGAASETFVDDDSRGMFHNAAEHRALYPDAPVQAARYCAPVVREGAALEAVRQRIAARHAGAPAHAPPGPLHGHLDLASRTRLTGWARDEARPDRSVRLAVFDNGRRVQTIVANRLRRDLRAAGHGHGRHGFDVALDRELSDTAPHLLELRREDDDAMLARATIAPAQPFDAALAQRLSDAVTALAPGAEQERVMSFLVAQLARARLLRPPAPPDEQRALVIDDDIPDSARDAGSQVVLSHMRALQSLGYRVSFAASRQFAATPAAASALDAAGIQLCRAPSFASVEAVLAEPGGRFAVIYLHRVANAEAYLALARRHQPRARILYNVADLHHIRLARQAAIEGRPELRAESRRLKLAECTAAWSADAVLTHSAAEAAWLRACVPGARVHEIGWRVPGWPTQVPFAQRSGVALIANYAHAPNLDAAHELVQHIMPLVWQRDPAIACLLVGSAMPAALRHYAGPRIEILPDVDPLSSVFDRVRLTVAPLRWGAGVKGKVLSSFAAGIPCVMTEIAAEGLTLPPPLAGLIAAGPAQLADKIATLHSGPAAYHRAAAAGPAFMAGWTDSACAAVLLAAIEGRAHPAGQHAATMLASGPG